MKEEFLKLLKTDYDKKYLEFIKILQVENGVAIQKALKNSNLLERESIMRQEVFNQITDLDWKKLANPYYIGFGNPNSKILIIGKEKAFDFNNKNLLIKESINNYIQWKEIISLYSLEENQFKVKNEIGFSPVLPKAYHSGKTKGRHTWKIISFIIKQISKEPRILEETNYLENSIFNECFLTELNYIPAKYTEGTGLTETRKQFLSQDFYKTFPIVIIGAKSYIKKKTETQIKEIFNAEYYGDIYLDTIGKIRKRDLIIKKYKSNNQTILLCDQLSGGSGWTIKSLIKFAEEITSGNNE